MNAEVQQALLYGTGFVILASTLVVFIVQYVRMNRRDKGDDS